jgi:dienelactone hydrolase
MTTEHGRPAAALATAAGFVVGFVPWIAYWILIGNVPFVTAVLVALGLSVLINASAVLRHQPLMVLEAGSTAVFVVFVVLGLTLSDDALARWLQPLGNLGLFLIVLVSVLIGRPFTLQYARRSTPREIWDQPGFLFVCRLLAWVWVGVLGFMTVIAAVPPIVDGDATLRDDEDVLSILCYWVLPYAALALGMIFTSKFPDWFTTAAGGPADAGPATPPAPPIPLTVEPGASTGSVAITVTPAEVTVDEVATVRIDGAAPGAPIDVTAEAVDVAGHRWRSHARFAADEAGRVDVGATTPQGGTWTHADARALVWSMEPATDGGAPDIYLPSLDPSAVLLTATSGGASARATVVRTLLPPTVAVHEVRTADVTGRLFLPAGSDHPGVVLFPGSEGGLDSQASNAALLAAHGCAALVAAPFSGDGPAVDGLPTHLERVPLERFTDAIAWLAAHPAVDASRVSAMAISRGAEGLLAALSRLAVDLHVVIAVSPSSATWEALGDDGSMPGVPAWTFAGQDVPFAATHDDALLREIAVQAVRQRGRPTGRAPAPLHLARAYRPAIDDAATTGVAAIASERIAAPLLLFAGTADEVWPSTVMAQRLLDRRPGVSGDRLTTYQDAGHLLRMGCWPSTVAQTGGIALGGTAAGIAAAEADLTARVVEAVTAAR